MITILIDMKPRTDEPRKIEIKSLYASFSPSLTIFGAFQMSVWEDFTLCERMAGFMPAQWRRKTTDDVIQMDSDFEIQDRKFWNIDLVNHENLRH